MAIGLAIGAGAIWVAKAIASAAVVAGATALISELGDKLDWTDKWNGPFDYTGNKDYDYGEDKKTETITPGTETVTPGTETVTPGTETVTPGTETVTPENPNEQYDDKTTVTLPTAPEIEDKTEENIEMKTINWLDWAEEQQEKEWDEQWRRMEAQWERDDTAWQRWVADMRKAGVNPNLINAAPTTGSAPMQPTQINLEAAMKEMQIDADKLMQMIEKDFQGDQNTKDRIQKYISNLISMGTMVGILYGKKGK